MKNVKKIYFMLFFLLIMLIPTYSVKADYVDWCKYDGTTNNDSSAETPLKAQVILYYDTDTDSFGSKAIYFKNSLATDQTVKDYGSFSDHNEDHQYMKSSSINEKRCPKNAYLDMKNQSEVCFDDDGSSCKSLNDSHHNFETNGTYTKSYDKSEAESDAIKTAVDFTDYPSCDDLSKKQNDDVFAFKYKTAVDNFLNDNVSEDSRDAVKAKILDKFVFMQDRCQNEIRAKYKNQPDKEAEENEKLNNVKINYEKVQNIINPTPDDNEGKVVTGCEGMLGTKFKDFLQDTFDFIQIIGPILAIILSMVDLLKASASGEDDAKKKAFKSTGNRIIASVLLYLIPAILTMILGLVDNVKGSTCGIS